MMAGLWEHSSSRVRYYMSLCGCESSRESESSKSAVITGLPRNQTVHVSVLKDDQYDEKKDAFALFKVSDYSLLWLWPFTECFRNALENISGIPKPSLKTAVKIVAIYCSYVINTLNPVPRNIFMLKIKPPLLVKVAASVMLALFLGDAIGSNHPQQLNGKKSVRNPGTVNWLSHSPWAWSKTTFKKGINFTFEQCQLPCLSYAIIRNNKIIILDEATVNVGLRTDLIQQITTNKFTD
uniref:Uncharacterized protein n=1 Tax=Vespula pensylvanica TaxID=30213 RepID=A0A834NR33_VESPE|nr:hypothetical protein H0235_012593 [Vespula pensylvanica]